jgi:hypothetical protein
LLSLPLSELSIFMAFPIFPQRTLLPDIKIVCVTIFDTLVHHSTIVLQLHMEEA